MPIQNEERRTERLRRWLALTLVLSVVVVAAWLLFGPLRVLANDNGGFISALGIFVVVPLALLTHQLVERSRRRRLAHGAENLLVFELWQNLNYVGQIETSYENNFELFDETNKAKGLHIPHYGPRVSVFEKFVTVEHLASLDEAYAAGLLEIYAQLCSLREEFPRWRNSLNVTSANQPLYEAYSSTLLSIIDPLMRNMMDLWVRLLATASFSPRAPEIAAAAEVVRSRIARGEVLHPAYKASRFGTHPRTFGAKDKIVCWRNDWKQAPVEVIELCDIAPLHPSWRKSAAI